MCLGSSCGTPSKTAIVRATFRMRSWARAEPLLRRGAFQQALTIGGKLTEFTRTAAAFVRCSGVFGAALRVYKAQGHQWAHEGANADGTFLPTS